MAPTLSALRIYSLKSTGLTGCLLNLDNDEFSRRDWGDSDDDVDDARGNVVRGRRSAIAIDEVGIESTLPLQVREEGTDALAQRCPERIGVRLKDCPFDSTMDALLDVESQA